MADNKDLSEGCYAGCGMTAVALVVLAAIGFGALFYFGFVQRGGVYDELRARMAQSQMNQIVPYIELYKAQRGSYPETLDQISDLIPADTAVMLSDSSDVNFQSPRNYHYERVGEDHYILRSVGLDGEAFTDDDIVPTATGEAARGLLRERQASTRQPPEALATEAPATETPQAQPEPTP